MKSVTAIATILLLAATMALGQSVVPSTPYASAGRVQASAYSNWRVHSINAVSAASGQTMTLDNCLPMMGTNNRAIFPMATNVPVLILDGSSTESVTPSSVSAPTPAAPSAINPLACSITGTFSYAHAIGVTIVSGDNGVGEAVNDAALMGAGIVTADFASGVTDANITAFVPVTPNVAIEYIHGSSPVMYRVAPSTLTALATPATRSASSGATQVISGTATGTWPASAEYVCVTYVDMLGGESPCSATYNFTATLNKALNFAAPAASTGAVGWRAYGGLSSLSTAYLLPISSIYRKNKNPFQEKRRKRVNG